MISMDKKYRTISGQPVRIVCVDREPPFNTNQSVIGLVLLDGQEIPLCYTPQGKYNISGADSRWDLVEIKPDVSTYSAIFSTGQLHDLGISLVYSKKYARVHGAMGLLKTTLHDSGNPTFEFIPKDKF